jgi:hypothetical protein
MQLPGDQAEGAHVSGVARVVLEDSFSRGFRWIE